MKNARVFFRWLRLLAALTAASAQTVAADPTNHGDRPPNWIAGTISRDTTLTTAAPGPTYILYGDVTVTPGVTLTVAPGVELQCVPNSDFLASGRYPDKVEISVGGHLVCQGTSAQPITIGTPGPNPSSWGGIAVGSTGDATLTYCNLAFATDDVFANAPVTAVNCNLTSAGNTALTGGPFNITNCVLQAQGNGVTANAPITIQDSDVSGGNAGLFLGSIELILRNTVVRDCAYGMIAAPSAHLDITGLTMFNVANGILAAQADGTLSSSSIAGRGSPFEGYGLLIGPGLSTMPADSAAPQPVIVDGFQFGLNLQGGGAVIRNVLTYNNQYGMFIQGNGIIIDYCTVADNGYGLYATGGGETILNTIVTGSQSDAVTAGLNTSIDFSDFWHNGSFPVSAQRGQHVADFDPYYASVPAYNLSALSLFTDYRSEC